MEVKRKIRDYRIFCDGEEELLTLEEWIAHKRLKKSQFARLVGVHPTTVSRWISGKARPQSEQLGNICHLFDCKPNEIAWKEPICTTTTTTRSGKSGNMLASLLNSAKSLLEEVV